MPRRFFKRLSRQRHTLKNRWFLRPFQALLEHPAYWSLHCRNVTRAVSLALLVCFIPLPVHIVTVCILGLWLRANLPVAIATVFVSNPLTWVPQFYAAYWTGSRMLGHRLHHFAFQMSWEWVQVGLLPIWKPFLLGCLALGIVAAILGYVLLGGLWHCMLVHKYHERKRNGTVKRSANVQK